ncbi:MAG: hypothetical protein VKI82_08140 [Leptolyngbya sp.]|nr:hypothetical protein [Leptolyngbya sp.]
MKIERPNAAPLTKADLNHLETLRTIVENVVADGLVTNDERAYIDRVIWADGEATPQELNLVQDLIWSKVQSGDLVLEWG